MVKNLCTLFQIRQKSFNCFYFDRIKYNKQSSINIAKFQTLTSKYQILGINELLADNKCNTEKNIWNPENNK